jgi:AraC-like DNA-binding protein
MAIDEVNYLFRVLTFSQATLIAIYFLVHERNRPGILVAVSAVAFACYLMVPFLERLMPGWSLIPAIMASSIPSFLWLLGHWFFRDERNIPLWLIVLTLIYVPLWLTPADSFASLVPQRDLRELAFTLTPQIVKLVLVMHVVYMALAGRESDLISARLRLRKPLAAGAGGLAALVILVEIWSDRTAPVLIEAIGSVLMFALSLFACLSIFRSRLDLSLSSPATSSGLAEAASDESTRVIDAMTGTRLYARHGLTLADLAEHLNVPTHRLREIINKQLGHRNFNQFLNQYRIEEAAERLRGERELPILTIALDVGFKSLSSFNTAFRASHGMTPSEYRSRHG